MYACACAKKEKQVRNRDDVYTVIKQLIYRFCLFCHEHSCLGVYVNRCSNFDLRFLLSPRGAIVSILNKAWNDRYF